MSSNHERMFSVPELKKPNEIILKPESTGAQALMLLGIGYPKDQYSIALQKEKIELIANKKLPEEHSQNINRASLAERQEYWKNRTDLSQENIMNEWRLGMNSFLDQYKKDSNRTAQHQFLKNIFQTNNLDEINADTFYNTFMIGEAKGDIEFFARRIVDTNESELLNKSETLIKNLAKCYGDNSAKIALLLTYGLSNAKNNPYKFTKSAQMNIYAGKYGNKEIWEKLEEYSKHNKKEKPAYTSKGAGETKQSTEHENQDRFFINDKCKAYGVFDGVTGSNAGAEAADAASRIIAEQLEKMPDNLEIEDAKNYVVKIIQKTNTYVRQTSGTTTASIVKIYGDKAIIVNIGDSRVYLQRNDKLQQLTQDDNIFKKIQDYLADPVYAQQIENLNNNTITKNEDDQLNKMPSIELTNAIRGQWNNLNLTNHFGFLAANTYFPTAPEGEYRQVGNLYISRDKNWFDNIGVNRTDGKILIPINDILENSNFVFNSLGRPTIKVKPLIIDIIKDDKLLLMTDGIYESLAHFEIEEIMKNNPEPDDSTKKLINKTQRVLHESVPYYLAKAQDRVRWKDDDQTIVVVKLQ